MQELASLLEGLEHRGADVDALGSMRSAVNRLKVNLESLDKLVADRMVVSELKRGHLTNALSAHNESQSLLTGEAAFPEVRQGIDRIATGTPGVVGTNQVLTMHFGPEEILVALSLDFDDAISAAQLEAAVAEIERGIRREFPDVTRVFVEARSAADHLRRR